MWTVNSINSHLLSLSIVGRLRNSYHHLVRVSQNSMSVNSATHIASMAHLIDDVTFIRGCTW